MDSSIWDEPDYVIKIFLTMMALKDSDHVVRLTPYQIAKRAVKTEDEVMDALKILCAPDKRRKEKQPHDGRRLKAVEDGWLVINGEKYRAMVQEEMRKARWRRAQKKRREKIKGGGALPGEAAYERALERGDGSDERILNDFDKLKEQPVPYHVNGQTDPCCDICSGPHETSTCMKA